MHLRGVDAALDDVEDGDVAPAAGGGGDHDVLGLRQPPHHVQHRGLAHRAGLSIAEHERSVAGHEEVASRGRDQRGHQTDQVIVHVAWVPQGGGGGGHDGGHQRVQLGHGGVRDPEPVDRDPVERRVVQHHHRVRVEGEALEGKDAVVRLHHHVRMVPVGEDGVGLDELLGEVVVQALQQVGPHAGTGPARDRVAQHEPL
mmetsp:Transcript_6258/g.10149  ORF Transcript_6258/g.10149 Transcript_6258/m.10149 type:complete len:200 (+) Transcript_6258:537-1136(+)